MRKVLLRALDLSRAGTLIDLDNETIECLNEIALSTALPARDILSEITGSEGGVARDAAGIEGRLMRVILPGSFGLDRMKDNEEFYVEAVFFNPLLGPGVQGLPGRL